MQVLYDNTDLNLEPYSINKLSYEIDPSRNIYAYPLARERGEIIVNTEYKSKIINIKGTITGTDKNDLDDKIDTFLELVSRQDKNLDISHGSALRRFIATKTEGEISRVYYQLNYALFTISFLIPSGVGQATSLTTETLSAITDASYSGTWTVGGSAYPTPSIKLTFNSADTISEASITINGDKITLAETINSSDIAIFDIENKKVTLNGIEKDYTGIFPNFVVGQNSYQIDITSNNHSYDLLLSYYKKYL